MTSFMDDPLSSNYFQNPNVPAKPKKTRIAPELSDLVVYCQSVPFTGSVENDVINFLDGPCTAISSFNETKARNLMVEKNRLNKFKFIDLKMRS